MSSTFQDQIGPLQRVIEALSALPVHGIVTTGPAIDASALNAVPNVTVLAHAPHCEVLQRLSKTLSSSPPIERRRNSLASRYAVMPRAPHCCASWKTCRRNQSTGQSTMSEALHERQREVDVIIRWRGYKGRYMLHCHNLEHEDHSMMARIDVV